MNRKSTAISENTLLSVALCYSIGSYLVLYNKCRTLWPDIVKFSIRSFWTSLRTGQKDYIENNRCVRQLLPIKANRQSLTTATGKS